MSAELTPDLIRSTALDVLASRPNGVRQTNFFDDVEAALSGKYKIPQHSIKNALWDLNDRYPEFVIKKKLSYRDVRLFPTQRLLEERGDSKTNWQDDILAYMETDEFKKIKLEMLRMKTEDLYRHIVFSEMNGLLEEILYSDSSFTPVELETLIAFKLTLDDITSRCDALNKMLIAKGQRE